MKIMMLWIIVISMNLYAVEYQTKTLEAMATKNNTIETIESLTKELEKFDKNRAIELAKFTKKNGIDRRAKLSKVSLKDGKFHTVMAGENLSYHMQSDLSMVIEKGEKKTVLSYQMALEEMINEIERSLAEQEKHSAHFLINDANAFSMPAAIIAFGAITLYSVYGMFEKEDFTSQMAETLKNCQNIPNAEINSSLIKDLSESYNHLSDKNIEVCLPGDSFKFKGFSKEGCQKLQEAKRCFKSKIAVASRGSVKNSNRGSGKKIEFNPVKDRYESNAGASR